MTKFQIIRITVWWIFVAIVLISNILTSVSFDGCLIFIGAGVTILIGFSIAKTALDAANEQEQSKAIFKEAIEHMDNEDRKARLREDRKARLREVGFNMLRLIDEYPGSTSGKLMDYYKLRQLPDYDKLEPFTMSYVMSELKRGDYIYFSPAWYEVPIPDESYVYLTDKGSKTIADKSL